MLSTLIGTTINVRTVLSQPAQCLGTPSPSCFIIPRRQMASRSLQNAFRHHGIQAAASPNHHCQWLCCHETKPYESKLPLKHYTPGNLDFVLYSFFANASTDCNNKTGDIKCDRVRSTEAFADANTHLLFLSLLHNFTFFEHPLNETRKRPRLHCA